MRLLTTLIGWAATAVMLAAVLFSSGELERVAITIAGLVLVFVLGPQVTLNVQPFAKRWNSKVGVAIQATSALGAAAIIGISYSAYFVSDESPHRKQFIVLGIIMLGAPLLAARVLFRVGDRSSAKP